MVVTDTTILHLKTQGSSYVDFWVYICRGEKSNPHFMAAL